MNRPFSISKQLYPFTSQWMEVDHHGQKINLHYIDEGQGPVIICFHGNPSWSLLYSGIIQNLKKDFRLIAFDLPGFGMSDKPAEADYGYTPAEHAAVLKQAIDQLDLTKFSIFIQDWGGPTGIGATIHRPDDIERMIIGNTWAWRFDPNSELGQSSAAFSQKMGSDAMREKIMAKNSFLNISMGLLVRGMRKRNPELVGELKEAYTAPFSTPQSRIPTSIFPREILNSGDFLDSLSTQLPSLAEKPTLLIWGEKDQVFPPPVREEWQRRLNNTTYVPLPDGNHFFQEDEPDLIASEIRKFWAK